MSTPGVLPFVPTRKLHRLTCDASRPSGSSNSGLSTRRACWPGVLGAVLILLGVSACTQSEGMVDMPASEDTGQGTHASSSTGETGSSTAEDGLLQAQVDAAVDGGLNGGVIAFVVRDGVTTHVVAGTKNAEGEPLSKDSLFNIGSVSKVYTATMIYQLAEEGTVALEAPLSTYLPDTAYGPEVTLESLLAHRSGVPDYAANPQYLQNALLDPERVFTTEELVDFAAFEDPSPAGESFSYSNTGYLLLGLVIETVTANTLESALQARIVEPLGLVSTAYVAPPNFPEDFPSGWLDPTNFGFPADTDLPVMPVPAAFSGCQADCGVVTTASELHLFFEAVFDGTLISSDSLEMMTRSNENAEASEGWGRGLQLYVPAGGAEPEYGHGGAGTGYTSLVTVRPDSGDVTIVFASNDGFELDGLLEAYAPSVLETW